MSEQKLKRGKRLLALVSAFSIAFTSAPVSAELLIEDEYSIEEPEFVEEEELSLDVSDNTDGDLILEEEEISGEEESFEEWETPAAEEDLLEEYSEDLSEEIAGDSFWGETERTGFSPADGSDAEILTEDDELSDGEELLYTPEGIRYIKGRPLTEEEREEQLALVGALAPIPEIEISEEQEDLFAGDLAKVGAAAAYDARSEGLVTPVKNQGSYLDCWAYALASQIETSVLAEGGPSMDLSEEHLAYFWCHRADDPLNNTSQDYSSISGDYHSGGNTQLGAFHLSTWSGMALDSSYPQGSGPFPASAAYDTVAYFKDTVFFSNKKSYSFSARVNRIKNMISTYKSASGLIAFSATAAGAPGSYYNPDTAAFSNPNEDAQVNHAVVIVGWDDSYSKSNFAAASKVTRDGAWIVKNSWGPSWGDEGYFYVSYQDMTLSSIVSASGTASPAYRNNYFYDGTAGLGTYYVEDGESIACVFKATAGNGKGETLGEIVTASGSDGATFSGQVYLGLTDPSDPTSGTPAYSSLTLSQTYLGMQTHKVDDVDIAPNTYYSVVLTNTSGKRIVYYFEKSLAYSWCSFTAGTAKNQSFIGQSGSWTDLSSEKISPRIKVHTRTEDFVPSMTVNQTSVTLTAGDTFDIVTSTSPASYASLGYRIRTSNSKVASIIGKKITAVSGGTAKITVCPLKAPNITKTITVKVIPKVPTGLKASLAAYNKVSLSWNAAPSCDGYTVFKQEAGGSPKYLYTVTGRTNTNYTEEENPSAGSYLKPGVKYTYYVKAYFSADGEKYYSDASNIAQVTPQMAKENATARTFTGPYNTVSYKRITGADGYRIYRRENGGSWVYRTTRYGNTPATYKDSYKLKYLTNYQYRVVPFREINGVKYNGPYSCSGILVTQPRITSVSKITKTTKGIKIVWNAQVNCTGYQVYRRTRNGTFKRITTIKDPKRNSMIDTKAKKGVEYQYYVVAYKRQFYKKCVFGRHKNSSYKKW